MRGIFFNCVFLVNFTLNYVLAFLAFISPHYRYCSAIYNASYIRSFLKVITGTRNWERICRNIDVRTDVTDKLVQSSNSVKLSSKQSLDLRRLNER